MQGHGGHSGRGRAHARPGRCHSPAKYAHHSRRHPTGSTEAAIPVTDDSDESDESASGEGETGELEDAEEAESEGESGVLIPRKERKRKLSVTVCRGPQVSDGTQQEFFIDAPTAGSRSKERRQTLGVSNVHTAKETATTTSSKALPTLTVKRVSKKSRALVQRSLANVVRVTTSQVAGGVAGVTPAATGRTSAKSTRRSIHHAVSSETAYARVKENPDEHLKVVQDGKQKRLRCEPCGVYVKSDNYIVLQHIRSKTHQNNKERQAASGKTQKRLQDCKCQSHGCGRCAACSLAVLICMSQLLTPTQSWCLLPLPYNQSCRVVAVLVGGTPSTDPRRDAFRASVVQTLLQSGVPLHKLEDADFRYLLEDGACARQYVQSVQIDLRRLTDCATEREYAILRVIILVVYIHTAITTLTFATCLVTGKYPLGDLSELYSLVPFVVDAESKFLATELGRSCPVALFYDGATKLAETYLVVARFVLREEGEPWSIEERIIAVDILSRSLNAEELAGVINDAVAAYGLRDRVALVQRDGASVNGAAFRALRLQGRPDAPKGDTVDGACLAHALNLVGEVMVRRTPLIQEFWDKLQVFVKSGKGRGLYVETFSKSPPSDCETRWWSTWDALLVLSQASVLDAIASVLEAAAKAKIAPAATNKMAKLILRKRDAQDSLLAGGTRLNGQEDVKVQLAVYLDFGQELRHATYFLEGDGFLAPFVSARMEQISTTLDMFTAADTPVAPRLNALAADLAEHEAVNKVDVVKYGQLMMRTAAEKFRKGVLAGKRYAPLLRDVYPALRTLDPSFARDVTGATLSNLVDHMMPWTEGLVEHVGVPTMTEEWQGALRAEIAQYKAACAAYGAAEAEHDGAGAAEPAAPAQSAGQGGGNRVVRRHGSGGETSAENCLRGANSPRWPL